MGTINKKIHVLHIISGLKTGGAELMLLRLLGAMKREDYTFTVISLKNGGEIGEKIRELGIRVYEMNLKFNFSIFKNFLTMSRLIRELKPDVVQTWLYHGDFFGGLASRLAGKFPIIWNLRLFNLDSNVNKPSILFLIRSCARLSYQIPWKIIVCSKAAATSHQGVGYSQSKMIVIPNGYDSNKYPTYRSTRIDVQKELKLENDALLIGLVARWDPQKDHETFLKAANIIRSRMPQVKYLLCGGGINSKNPTLMKLVREQNLEKSVFLLDVRNDIPRLMGALDLVVLSSVGEAFPNVVAEAMSCGVPCVATKVGGVSEICGNTGILVRPKSPNKMAEACIQILKNSEEERMQFGLLGKERVKNEFSMSVIAEKYSEIYSEAICF